MTLFPAAPQARHEQQLHVLTQQLARLTDELAREQETHRQELAAAGSDAIAARLDAVRRQAEQREAALGQQASEMQENDDDCIAIPWRTVIVGCNAGCCGLKLRTAMGYCRLLLF